MEMTMTDIDVHIAEEVSGWHVCYPDAFDDARDLWLEFIHDPDATTETYAATLTDQIDLLEEYGEDVPGTDKIDVIVSSFWAATADSQLNQRAETAHTSTGELRKALHEHTEW